MKQIRYIIGCVTIALFLSGCIEKIGSAEEWPHTAGGVTKAEQIIPMDSYRLHISFKDPAGHDLLEQTAYYKSDPTSSKYLGEVNPDFYTLRIASSYVYALDTYYFTLAKFDEHHSWLPTDINGVYHDKGTWYLSNDFIIQSKPDGSPYSPLRYNICCPTIFGSTWFHTLITWWEEGPRDEKSGQHFPICVRANIDGREITPVIGITYNEKNEPYYFGYFLDIVVDRLY